MKFIPKVIILGDINRLQHDFPTQFEIIGQLEINDSKFFFEGKEIQTSELQNIPFDYILCTDRDLYKRNRKMFLYTRIPFGQFTTQNQFRNYVSNIGFTAHDLTMQILEIIRKTINYGTILDLDGYFVRAGMFNYPKEFEKSEIKIEGIVRENFAPIFHNVYSEIFSNPDETKIRHYDLILLTAERSIEDWIKIFNERLNFCDGMLAFIHKDSPVLQKFKSKLRSSFKIEWQTSIRGEFMQIKITRGSSAKIFIATHDKFCLPELPSGYQLIHAGKKISTKDLGILGDDTGDNVSELNLQINELPVIYWAWKNTRTDYIGFADYRRYFATPNLSTTDQTKNFVAIGRNSEHIMKIEEGIEILKNCDILVGIPTSNFINIEYDFRDYDRTDFDNPNYIRGVKIFRRWLEKMQPDYLETLNQVEASHLLITNTIFFTRWSLFEKYCEWIFSFLIPAAREFENFIPNARAYATDTRTMSYKSEHAFMVWCMHNRLRMKFLPILLNQTDMRKEFGAENFRRLDRIIV